MLLASSEYPPYYGSNLPQNGVLAEIVVESFRAVGYKTKIVFQPFSRSLLETKNGQFDGMFSVWHRMEREEWFVYSQPYSQAKIGFYRTKNRPIAFNNTKSQKRYLIGIGRGYAIPADIEKMGALVQIQVRDDLTNMQLLLLNRIDLVLTDKKVGAFIINHKLKSEEHNVVWDDTMHWYENQHLVLSKNAVGYEQTLLDFNRGLSIIEKSGQLTEIKKKHRVNCTTQICF